MEWVRAKDFAEEVGVGVAQVNSLLKKDRIPESYRDEDGYYRIPLKRCVIPSLYPRQYGVINDWFMTKEDVENLEDGLREDVIRRHWKAFGYDEPPFPPVD